MDGLLLIVILLILLFLGGYVYLRYSGVFYEVEVKTVKTIDTPLGEWTRVAYKYVKLPYYVLLKELRRLTVWENYYLPAIGIYYDDLREGYPIRCAMGLIANYDYASSDLERFENLPSFNKECRTYKFEDEYFKDLELPEVEYVVYASFPRTTSYSVHLASRKVLPLFREYIKEHKLQASPIMEIFYRDEVVYISPLSKQEEFLVPEAKDCISEKQPKPDQRTVEETEQTSAKEVQDVLSTKNLIDSLSESKDDELPPSVEFIDSLENGKGLSNESDASTESFEELQLDS